MGRPSFKNACPLLLSSSSHSFDGSKESQSSSELRSECLRREENEVHAKSENANFVCGMGATAQVWKAKLQVLWAGSVLN